MTVSVEEAKKYLERFIGSKPLIIYPKGSYPSKCNVDFVESEIELE